MQPSNQHSRVDLVELKAQIVKKIGAERSKLYFYYLNKLLNLKLNKIEFNKLCFRILGRDNIPLHNQLLCSILKNACDANVPPLHDKEVPTTASNGSYAFPNGKVDFASHQSTVAGDNAGLEDRIPKLLQHHQVLLEKAGKGGDVLLHHSAKLPLVKQVADGLDSVYSKEWNEISVVEDGKVITSTSPLQAPLGIPTMSVGGVQRPLPLSRNGRCASSIGSGRLLDTQTLRERMEQIAAAQGINGVSMDSASLLNSGLDVYLRKLIKSCIDIVDARRGSDLGKNNIHRCHFHRKNVNGFLPGYHFQLQDGSRLLSGVQEERSDFMISLQDFKVAMELNPQQLGQDWPLLLEKIYMHAFDA